MRDASGPSGFDAVVVGSAVYSMRWMPEATAFILAHRLALSERPVWLFSSGRDWGAVEAWAHAIVNELPRTKEEE